MGTTSSLIHTAIAESPVTLVALAAFPEAFISRGLANIAKKPRDQTSRWVVIGDLSFATGDHLRVVRGPLILERAQYMACLAHFGRTMIWRREDLFVYCLSSRRVTIRARRVSVGVISIRPITPQTEVIVGIFAFGTLFVHIILNIRHATAITRDRGLPILGGRRRDCTPP